jgi:hypothetical protein
VSPAFWLGTHQPGWLARLDVPLFASHRTLRTRRRLPLPGCHRHRNCANCPRYALAWRARVLAVLEAPRQLHLPLDLDGAA